MKKILYILTISVSPFIFGQEETPGYIDTSFTASFNNAVRDMAYLPDGSIVTVGTYSNVNENSSEKIAILNADGTLKQSFPGTGGNTYAVEVSSDGSIIVGGDFSSVNGISVTRLAKLIPNNSGEYEVDASFNAGNTGPNYSVNAVELLEDGSILIGGQFTTYNDFEANNIAKISADGTLDTSFSSGAGTGAWWSPVNSIDALSDGKILIGGSFQKYNNVKRWNVAKLNADGSLDETFNETGEEIASEWTTINFVAEHDNNYYIGGSFFLKKTDSDGIIDSSFYNYSSSPTVYDIVFAGEKILVGCNMAVPAAGTGKHLMRLNSDGTVDSTFNPSPDGISRGPGSYVYKILMTEENEKAIIGGNFSNYTITSDTNTTTTTSVGRIARIFNEEATDTLGVQDSNSTQIQLYPNPAQDFISFKGNTVVKSVQIFSLDGKLVLNGKTDTSSNIDISDLKTGNYLVKAFGENQLVKTFKLLKK